MKYLVIGMGITGLSIAKHWLSLGYNVEAIDTRIHPPKKEEFLKIVASISLHYEQDLVSWCDSHAVEYEKIAVSPGIDWKKLPLSDHQRTSDGECFHNLYQSLSYTKMRLLAVTGTNGKSTVTALAAHIANRCGYKSEAVGNFGVPLLEAWAHWQSHGFPDVVVVELSSFQLELNLDFYCDAAVLLNVGCDHLDRHHNQERYAEIKGYIYRCAQRAIVNSDDSCAVVQAKKHTRKHCPLTSYSLKEKADWMLVDGAIVSNDKRFLLEKMSLTCQTMPTVVIAALALLSDLPLKATDIEAALASFIGLEHRQQFVLQHKKINYINDSKATNADATVFSINAIVSGKIILIAGGEEKGQDFAILKAVSHRLCHVILLGQNVNALERLCHECLLSFERTLTMSDAVVKASMRAKSGDTVLLAPACASLDMFENYQDRGNAFIESVNQLLINDTTIIGEQQ